MNKQNFLADGMGIWRFRQFFNCFALAFYSCVGQEI